MYGTLVDYFHISTYKTHNYWINWCLIKKYPAEFTQLLRLGNYLVTPQPWPSYLFLYIPTSNVLLRSLRQLPEQRQLRPWYGQASARWRKALFFTGPLEPEVQGEQSSFQIFADIEAKSVSIYCLQLKVAE